MERRLIAAVHRTSDQNPILSLITNPYTSDTTISPILETLIQNLQNPNQTLSLLAVISLHRPTFRRRVAAAAAAVIQTPAVSIPIIPHALTLLDTESSAFYDESVFLSVCYWHCVKTRRWMLRNVGKFRLRVSVLVAVFIGFSKDPFPCVREAALDGLVSLLLSECGVGVEERSLVEVCYFRAVELLFDDEIGVRCSAVRAVSEWGQLLVALNRDTIKKEWSDVLFVQLCLMVRDTDVGIRVAAFDALGKIQTVSEEILLQTLSKKALPAIKDKYYPGQYTAKLFKLPAVAASLTFVHGLEDEYHEVRRSACRALRMPTILSAEFAGGAVHILMDLLNDDSMVVRLQALKTMYHMSMHDNLTVEDSHLHMFFGALIDNNGLVRSAARKTVQFTKLPKLAMFRSCIDGLIKNLELYPEDEADLFSTVYKIGRTHGKFVTSIIREVSQELEPSFDGKLGFNMVRTAALLVLAISAPVSLERQICSIPPQIFSYAVTILGRISSGLVDVMDQSTLLAYLTYCSRFTVASASEFLKGEVLDNRSTDNVHLWKKCDETSGSFPQYSMELEKHTTQVHDYLLDSHTKATSSMEIVLRKVVDFWPMTQLGCWNEAVRTLRIWKQELKIFNCGSRQPTGVLVFAMNYLHVIKLLGNAWACYFSKRNLQGMGALDTLLGKTERKLKEMLYRYTGLSREENLQILELMLVTYTLRLSYGGICCFEYMQKVNFVLSRVECLCKEGPLELSHFVNELQNLSCETGNTEDGLVDKLYLFQKSLNLFSLKHFVLSGELKYLNAEVVVCGNNFQNPIPFISGLPVGIPFHVKMYNISSETRLWLTMTLGEKSTQFVFLDFDEFEECNEVREFTFIAPFYKTPMAKCFSLRVSIAMECSLGNECLKQRNGPKHELVHLCKGTEVHLSKAVK